MTPRIRPTLRFPPEPDPLRVTHPDAAGIDVGAAAHWVAVPPDRDPQPVRCFGAYTADLRARAAWLKACRVTTVVLESTGVSWIPLFELLEAAGLEVLLIDPRQACRQRGRPKTDVHDCQWLQRLHTYGLLAKAFRPADQVVVLRGYLRQRQMLVTYAAQHIQHMQKALELMNVKLPEVISDVTGATGLRIIKAILGGQRDPAELAKRRDHRCKADEAEIARALEGNWRAEHLLALKQAVALYETYRRQEAECDRAIRAHLATFADKSGGAPVPPRARRARRLANGPSFDARSALYRAAGVDLTAIEGIDESTALVLLAEIGLDMSAWPSAKHFCSWLGLCPHPKISGGKVLRRRVRPGAQRAAQALRLAARALHFSKSALGAYFRRMKARLGAPKATVAAAHKLARLVYSLLKEGAAYVAQSMEEYEQAYQQRAAKGLARRAQELGYQLVPIPAEG